MEPSTTMIILTAGGLFAAGIGVLVFLVDLIILFVRAIMRKTVKVPLILMVVGIVLIFVGLRVYASSYGKIAEDYSNSLDEARLSKAETDTDGNIVYRIGDDFSVKDDNGNTIDSSTLAAYKYTIVNMWEPWCGPCKAELPDLEKLYENYKDKGVNMIGVYNTLEDAATVIAEYGLTYPTVYMEGDSYADTFGTFQTGSVPVTFVLDSEGKLVKLGLTEVEIVKNGGENLSAEMHAFYEGVIPATRTYEFWSEKLDTLLG